MSRPERVAPPDLFYDEKEAGKYTGNSRIITIQTSMAERCLELLNFPPDEPKLVLDIGCGSGISGGELPFKAYRFRHGTLSLSLSRCPE